MAVLVAVSGKGGVGKTAITALMLKHLLEAPEERDVLVVDADPAANLADVLGLELDERMTVGYVANKFKKMMSEGRIPPGVDKGALLESQVLEVVQEYEGFDLLVMWRTEGEGCYCFVNDVLSRAIEWLMDGYDLILMDCEAGLEHFNRRVFKALDHLVIVVDGSKASFDTARRIMEVVKEVEIKVRNSWILANKVSLDLVELMHERSAKLGLSLLGVVPFSETLYRYLIEGRSLLELPSDDLAVKAVGEVCRRLGLI